MNLDAILARLPGGRWHRGYVGGLWDEVGRLQMEFLVSRGLEPRHYLMDVACGSLRLGVHAIPYLEPGHYLGIDKDPVLIRNGIRRELGRRIAGERRPVLIADDAFRFERFAPLRADFAMAQSLFTHLTPAPIELCLRNLRYAIAPGGVFYVTWFEGDAASNPTADHNLKAFYYSRSEMESFGRAAGWEFEYIGDWGHPRGQAMTAYRPATPTGTVL